MILANLAEEVSLASIGFVKIKLEYSNLIHDLGVAAFLTKQSPNLPLGEKNGFESHVVVSLWEDCHLRGYSGDGHPF